MWIELNLEMDPAIGVVEKVRINVNHIVMYHKESNDNMSSTVILTTRGEIRVADSVAQVAAAIKKTMGE